MEHHFLTTRFYLDLAVGDYGQADLKEGRLPTAVLQLFPAAPKPSKPDGPKPKRRRM